MPSQSAQPRGDEWSRSRYWLCHFLYSRHDRLRIDWSGPAGDNPALPPAVNGLIRRLTAPQAGMDDVLQAAPDRCPGDPAFVQSLRLLDRERQFHRSLLVKLMHRHAPDAPAPLAPQTRKEVTASLLGMRYFLASLLLDDILDLNLLNHLQSHWQGDPVAKSACQQVARDKASHVAFLHERLTMEYADFNFIRRNLRRMRLRGLFAIHLQRVLAQDGATLSAIGVGRLAFARQCRRQFERVLESMVPYRRSMLMATLLTQREKPYDHARKPTLS